MTVNTEPRVQRGLPRWAIVLLAVVGAGTLAIITLTVAVVVSILSGPTFGPTPAAALQPGYCLAEAPVDLDTYTVVDCESAHAQEVVAELDLSRNTEQYSTPSALASYASEICDRFYEYGLYVAAETDDRFRLVAIAVPSPDAVATGSARALCSLEAVDGSALTTSYFRAMP